MMEARRSPKPTLLVVAAAVIALSGLAAWVGSTRSPAGASPIAAPDPVEAVAAATDSSPSVSMANPAAVYCEDLGYGHATRSGPLGESGVCVFPDGSECDDWEFLEGTCGAEYSYCSLNGYDQRVLEDGANPFSPRYAQCVAGDGTVVGPVTELTGLDTKVVSSGCGNEASGGATRLPERVEPAPVALEPLESVGAPAAFDWRDYQGQNWITSVKDQVTCGGCWAFATLGVTEAMHNIASNDPGLDLNLSEEYMISDCYFDGSCCGGWHNEAFNFIMTSGVPDEQCMPWASANGCGCDQNGCPGSCPYRSGGDCSNRTCGDRCANWSSRLTSIDDWGFVSANVNAIKQAVVDRGPLAVAIRINVDGYWDSNDVYRCSTNSTNVNHAVVITGYNEAGGYWIIKNSWGTGWGDNGYFRMGYGECMVEDYVFYAVVSPTASKPGQPRNLSAAGGNQQASLSWTAPASDGGAAITDYVVQYRRGGTNQWQNFQDGVSTGTSATVTGLTNGNRHEFRVAAKNSAGTGAWSATASATPSGGASTPGEPRNLAASPGNQQVSLSWTVPTSDGGAAITDYVVQYRRSGSNQWQSFQDGVSTSTSTTVTGLTNGTEYEFRVGAKNSVGTGSWSSVARATPAGSTSRPSQPRDLAAAPGDRIVALSWTAPATDGGAPITDYVVKYREVGATLWTRYADGLGSETSATVTGLSNGITYEFKVAARNRAGRGRFSPKGSATPSGDVTLWNDMFSDAVVVTGTSGSIRGRNEGATTEPGEPGHVDDIGHAQASHSVWWEWKAPSWGTVVFSTHGSDFDTVLAVYTGDEVYALTEEGSNDDVGYGWGDITSAVSFTAKRGTTYRIAVDGYGDETGDVVLNWSLQQGAPANDLWSDATEIIGAGGSVSGSNVNATVEPGEASHGGQGSHSVWWSWTAPGSFRMNLNTHGSGFDTVLGVYRGNSVDHLVAVAVVDDADEGLTSRVIFDAYFNTTYWIVVDGFADAVGPITLNWATSLTGLGLPPRAI